MRSQNPMKIALLVVFLLGVATFYRALSNSFTNWDDPPQILHNPLVHELSWPNLKRVFTTAVVSEYHPLVTLSYSVEYHLWKVDPFPYHFHNFFLHLANSFLVFQFIYRLRRGRALSAFFAALLFTAHPFQVQTVAWISGRKDLLFTFFYLLSLLAYLGYLKTGRRRYYIFSLLGGVASLLCKAVAVTLPLVLILCDYYQGRRFTGKVLREKIPFLIVAILSGLLALKLQLRPGGVRAILPGAETINLLLGLRAYIFYLSRALYPLHLSPFYPFSGGTAGIYISSVLIFFSLAAFILCRVKKYSRSLIFGGLFFFVTLLPVSRLIPFGGQEIFALRFMYLPLLGLCFMAAAGLRSSLLKRTGGRVIIGALIAIAVIFAVLSREKVVVWKDSYSLWREVLKYNPEYPLAHSNLASVCYYQRRDYGEALLHCDRALAGNPRLAYAYVLRGLCLQRQGEASAARESFQQGRKILKEFGTRDELAQVERYLKALSINSKHQIPNNK